MLSILIPIYNTKCAKLVEDLHVQCELSDIDFEILCYDDNSTEEYKKENQRVSNLSYVHYKELEFNLGRAKIRNKLALNAIYDNLLFIDADSEIVNDDYFNNYFKEIKSAQVIYGGRIYSSKEPSNIKKILHWKYGSVKESLNAKVRSQSPYLNFMSNNFIINKSLFNKVKFDEKHQGYGYEDTLFAEELGRYGSNVKHIENPLIHLGLEDTDIFLKKAENAIENLTKMYLANKIMDTRLIKIYKILKKLGLVNLFGLLITKKQDYLLKNLYTSNPRLIYLQIFKLGLFVKNIRENSQ